MTYATYLTTFTGLSLSDSLSGSFCLLPGLEITNDATQRSRLLTQDFATAAGVIETEFLLSAPVLVFGEFDEAHLAGSTPEGFLLAILSWVNFLFRDAWLLWDHSLTCEAAFLTIRTHPSGPLWTKNHLATRPTVADGSGSGGLCLSLSDLRAWEERSQAVEVYLHERSSSSLDFPLTQSFARTGRAMQFIDAARNATNPALKLAHYCSALETLFTTDTAELSHKLAERLAFFLSTRGYTPREVFETVKTVYGIRSRTVHGDTLSSKTIEHLPLLSVAIDAYLRTVMNTIFDSSSLALLFDGQGKALEDYFSDLLLGPRVA